MGLRVGASEKGLSGPGDGMTLASLKEAAETPVSAKPPVMRAPASAPSPAPAAPAKQSANIFDSMASNAGSGESQGGAAQGGATPAPHPNGPPSESFAEGAMAKVAGAAKYAGEHAEMLGAIGGDIAGKALGTMGGAALGALGGPGGAIAGAIGGEQAGGSVGSGVGAALGQKLERFVKGEPQPSGMESLKTAGWMAAAGAAGEYVISPIAKVAGGKLIAAGKSVYDASSPAIEAASQSIRTSAKDLLNYVGDKFPLFKHEMIDGTPAAATAEGQLADVSKNGSISQKQQLWSFMKQRADAIFHNLTVLHEILPKPSAPLQEDIKDFVPNWIERHGQQVGMYKEQISDIIGDKKADVSGFLDGLGAHLRQAKILDDNGAMMKSISPDQRFLANFYTDMIKLTKQPAPAKTGFDSAWDLISQQEWKGAVAETPVATVSFNEAKAASGRMLDMDTFNTVMRRVQKEAVVQGGDILPMISKDMTNRYYNMMSQMAKQAGREDISTGLLKANQEYSSLIDFAGDTSRQIQKNPSAAVSVMVNAKNPTATATMMRMLSPDQQKTLARAFVSSSVQDAFDASTKSISAKDVLAKVTSVGDANLRLLFGSDTKNIVGGLQRLALLQKTNLSYGAQENIVNDLAKMSATSKVVRQVVGMAKDWFAGRPDVSELLGGQDFADKVFRVQSGLESAGQKRIAAIGKSIQGSASTLAKLPIASGAAIGSKISDQNAKRQMEEEANPFNQ